MENIVSAVHQNQAKVSEWMRVTCAEILIAIDRISMIQIQSQYETLSVKRDHLQRCLLEYAAEEQHYRSILKALSQESHKYKYLSSQLGSAS